MSDIIYPFEGKLKPAQSGRRIADSVDVEVDSTNLINAFANSGDVQAAIARLDATGLGADINTFTGSFFANYIEGTGNQGIWYGFRQSNMVVGARGQANGNYTFQLPDPTELNAMFDDLASRGVAEVFTITIGYLGGNVGSVVRNSLTVVAPSI